MYILDESKHFSNNKLGCYLAFVAGAVNAGGFLAIGRYTSHMTGAVAEVIDNLILRDIEIIKIASLSVLFFMIGAFISTLLINFCKNFKFRSKYAIVFLLEGIMILIFGILASYSSSSDNLLIIAILTSLMGLQNATMTKISRAVVRTSHITGMLTDISIELGKLFSKVILPKRKYHDILVNYKNLLVHTSIVLSFILGGICGAYGFAAYGFLYVIPLSLLLVFLSVQTLVYDFKLRSRFLRRKNKRYI